VEKTKETSPEFLQFRRALPQSRGGAGKERVRQRAPLSQGTAMPSLCFLRYTSSTIVANLQRKQKNKQRLSADEKRQKNYFSKTNVSTN